MIDEKRRRFGYALQKALDARGMSEPELATRLGVDPRKVARWRSAKALPDLYQAIELADALGVDEALFWHPPAIASPIGRYLRRGRSWSSGPKLRVVK